MSEIKKNIETCRGEDVLAEVSALPQDPHFGSLVNEALDPLKQQALHQAGYDGYSEVIAQHKPYTFASAIIQMKSNLLLLLRALWQFPFGTGTLRSLSDDASLRSLADMWQHYITRLQGNATYGIPSRLSQLTDLPSAPALLSDRKISGADCPDGMSLAHVMFSTAGAATVTEITDDNTDWDIIAGSSITRFVNVEKATINGKGVFRSEFVTSANIKLKEVYIPGATELRRMYGTARGVFTDCPLLEVIEAENAKDLYAEGTDYAIVYECPKLRKLRLGKLTVLQRPLVGTMPDIIHLEIGAETAISLNMAGWNPTNALDASLDTLVTDEDCHNNLEQFLKNFRTYIALRLAAFDSNGPTLTLSAAVFSSIWDANGNPQVLGDGLDQLRADIHNIVKTTKHWDVNKAS